MAVLQDIERRIEELSPSGFQQLCDAYLLSKNREIYSAFMRKGSMLGKDKTIKGTPDTVIYTYENRILLIEYSTDSTAKAKKLIEDIDKCIKEYGSKISQVETIILFANYRLEENEVIEIKGHATSKRANCEIYDVGSLALDINTNHSISSQHILAFL